jgi:hypothetical protein
MKPESRSGLSLAHSDCPFLSNQNGVDVPGLRLRFSFELRCCPFGFKLPSSLLRGGSTSGTRCPAARSKVFGFPEPLLPFRTFRSFRIIARLSSTSEAYLLRNARSPFAPQQYLSFYRSPLDHRSRFATSRPAPNLQRRSTRLIQHEPPSGGNSTPLKRIAGYRAPLTPRRKGEVPRGVRIAPVFPETASEPVSEGLPSALDPEAPCSLDLTVSGLARGSASPRSTTSIAPRGRAAFPVPTIPTVNSRPGRNVSTNTG